MKENKATGRTKARKSKVDVYSADCPSRAVLDDVTSTWGTLVLVILLDGTLRFGEIRDEIGGISEKMLAQTLQALEKNGLVLRKAYPVIPPKVEYSLTPSGREAAGHVRALTQWVESNLPKLTAARAAYRARDRRSESRD